MKEDIPIERLYSNPIVQELLEKASKQEFKDIENIKIPHVLKDKVLMSPGIWNNHYYSPEAIADAFISTRWDNKEIRSLFLDHADRSSREWVGEVINPRLRGEDLVGDLVIVDKPTAQKLAYGAKMGISPKVHGQEDNNKMLSFLFDNFSVVINPAVKTAYINNMEVQKMAEEKVEDKKEEVKKEAPKETATEKVENKEEEKKLSDSDELIEAMSEIKSEMGVADIVKKAKEIRKEGEAWKEAMQRAAKMMSEEEKPAEVKEEPIKEMADSDVIDQILKLAAILQKKKKYPYPEEPKAEMEQKPNEENLAVKEMKGTIQTLCEQVQTLTKKLNEPDKKTLKTEELSQADAEQLIMNSPDLAFLNVLQRMG